MVGVAHLTVGRATMFLKSLQGAVALQVSSNEPGTCNVAFSSTLEFSKAKVLALTNSVAWQYTSFKFGHSANVLESNLLTFLPKLTEANTLQLQKAQSPISVTPSGMTIEARQSQSLNDSLAIFSKLFGRVKEVNATLERPYHAID